MGEKKTFMCPNAACGKSFTVPLKTLNLQDTPPEPYYACPFCLTKIEAPELKSQERHSETPATTHAEETIKTTHKDLEKPAACSHHLGYLSERGQKEIPEDCLLCKDIVTCMLKKMRET